MKQLRFLLKLSVMSVATLAVTTFTGVDCVYASAGESNKSAGNINISNINLTTGFGEIVSNAFEENIKAVAEGVDKYDKDGNKVEYWAETEKFSSSIENLKRLFAFVWNDGKGRVDEAIYEKVVKRFEDSIEDTLVNKNTGIEYALIDENDETGKNDERIKKALGLINGLMALKTLYKVGNEYKGKGVDKKSCEMIFDKVWTESSNDTWYCDKLLKYFGDNKNGELKEIVEHDWKCYLTQFFVICNGNGKDKERNEIKSVVERVGERVGEEDRKIRSNTIVKNSNFSIKTSKPTLNAQWEQAKRYYKQVLGYLEIFEKMCEKGEQEDDDIDNNDDNSSSVSSSSVSSSSVSSYNDRNAFTKYIDTVEKSLRLGSESLGGQYVVPEEYNKIRNNTKMLLDLYSALNSKKIDPSTFAWDYLVVSKGLAESSSKNKKGKNKKNEKYAKYRYKPSNTNDVVVIIKKIVDMESMMRSIERRECFKVNEWRKKAENKYSELLRLALFCRYFEYKYAAKEYVKEKEKNISSKGVDIDIFNTSYTDYSDLIKKMKNIQESYKVRNAHDKYDLPGPERKVERYKIEVDESLNQSIEELAATIERVAEECHVKMTDLLLFVKLFFDNGGWQNLSTVKAAIEWIGKGLKLDNDELYNLYYCFSNTKCSLEILRNVFDLSSVILQKKKRSEELKNIVFALGGVAIKKKKYCDELKNSDVIVKNAFAVLACCGCNVELAKRVVNAEKNIVTDYLGRIIWYEEDLIGGLREFRRLVNLINKDTDRLKDVLLSYVLTWIQGEVCVFVDKSKYEVMDYSQQWILDHWPENTNNSPCISRKEFEDYLEYIIGKVDSIAVFAYLWRVVNWNGGYLVDKEYENKKLDRNDVLDHFIKRVCKSVKFIYDNLPILDIRGIETEIIYNRDVDAKKLDSLTFEKVVDLWLMNVYNVYIAEIPHIRELAEIALEDFVRPIKGMIKSWCERYEISWEDNKVVSNAIDGVIRVVEQIASKKPTIFLHSSGESIANSLLALMNYCESKEDFQKDKIVDSDSYTCYVGSCFSRYADSINRLPDDIEYETVEDILSVVDYLLSITDGDFLYSDYYAVHKVCAEHKNEIKNGEDIIKYLKEKVGPNK